MEASLNDFSKQHLKAFRENSYYTLIHGNDNYELWFKDAKSLREIYSQFFDGIKLSDGTDIKLPTDDIIGFYSIYHSVFSDDDLTLMSERTYININNRQELNNLITKSKQRVLEMKNYARNIGAKIEMDITTMETYQPVDYDQTENSVDKFFTVTTKDKDGSIREIDESDILDIFDMSEPNIRYPVVIYSNPVGDYRYKCSNNNVIDFDDKFLTGLKLSTNTISVVTKAGDVTTIDFETASTVVKTNSQREDDGRVTKLKIFFRTLFFEENENKPKKIKGKIRFNVNKVIANYDLYSYFITDPIASVIFYINETARAWCSKNNFEVFFRDYSNEMVDGTNIKTNDSYFKITIPTNEKDSATGFTVTFTIKSKDKSKDMLPSFLYKFSRLLTHFMSLSTTEIQVKSTVQVTKAKIYIKPSFALVGEAPEFFKHLTKERGEAENKTKGKDYNRKCQAGNQPIIIQDEEVEDWIYFGRQPVQFPPPEWGFSRQIWVVCPTEKNKFVVLLDNEQDETGRIKSLPCCNSTGILKSKTSHNTIANSTGRSGITEAVSNLSAYGTLNEALSRFLAMSFDKNDRFNFQRRGTVFKDQQFTYLNSVIIALLAATDLQVEDGVYLSMARPEEIYKNVNIIRNRMAMLSPDVYRQELYDMTDEEIIQSIIDPETFIDPYLYYRGLEIIFGVQIVTFTSSVNRKHPLSEEENDLPIASLEIPRCKFTHIRHLDNPEEQGCRSIVCIYKNHGSSSNPTEIPACELIVCVDKQERPFAKRIEPIFVDFHRNVGSLIKRSCHPIEWERTPGVKIGDSLYDDPYSTIDWNKYVFEGLGNILGQEIDIYGKTTSLIFKDWTLIIPPAQPIAIFEMDGTNGTKTRTIKIRQQNGEYLNHNVFASGTKTRPQLRTLAEVKEKFEISEVDEDGAWLEFNGKKRGIKVPYLTKKFVEGKNMDLVYNQIKRKNNVSTLMQIINWMWRSEWTLKDGYPNFKEWWALHTVEDNSVIFDRVPIPLKNCQNYMFPRHCNTYEERLLEMSKLWPYFFYHGKIHVSKELSLRILNFFQVEYVYSSGLTPNDIYGEPGRFITNLIPTDEDYKSEGSKIFTEKEHIQTWASRNNTNVFKYSSFSNANVIKETVSLELRKMTEYYFYIETSGDNHGQIYMIQNSAVFSRPAELSALNIARYWKVHEHNPGAYFKKEDDINFASKQPYVVYKIGPQGKLEVAVDRSEGSTDYLQILNYNDEVFAAMIPLLVSTNIIE